MRSDFGSIEEAHITIINRRKFIKKLIFSSAATIYAPYVWTQPRMILPTAQKLIIVRDPGGIFSSVFAEVLYKPFMKATGIKVVSVAAQPNPIAEIITMVKSKCLQWDMALLANRAVHLLTTEDIYLERHGLESDPIISSIPKQFISPYSVGSHTISTALAYRADKFKRVPESWKDFWDVENFPGRRSLRKHPIDTVEAALMASGVPTENVYPCDLDKAFNSLDKIKSHIAVWWTHGPHSEQLLKSGEIDLMMAWTVRITEARKAGLPVQIAWNQHIHRSEHWAILKGSPNVELCQQLIRFACEPKRQALLAQMGVGPVQPDAFKYIPLEQQKLLPNYPDNLKNGLYPDDVYWTRLEKSAVERFNHWILS